MKPTPILTLEPLIDAVRDGVQSAGWELSGLQKTTSHQFEGRWEGDSTRSAYIFFHPPAGPEWVSVDVYLDETSRGLSGNLALVVDLRDLGDLESAEVLLARLAGLFAQHAEPRHRRPVTLRFRMADAEEEVAGAETEVRFKVRLPRGAMQDGAGAVESFISEVMTAFEAVLAAPSLQRVSAPDVTD